MERDRIDKFLSYIPLENFLVVVKQGPNMFYLTGFEGEGYLCITPKSRVLFTDGRYIEEAKNLKNISVEVMTRSRCDFILSVYEGGPVFVEYGRMTCRELVDLQRLPLSGNISSVDWIFSDMRKCKSSEEIAVIKKAIKVAEESLFYILDNYLREGVSEKDLAAEFVYRILKKDSFVSFDPIFLFGENTSKPHGKPSPRKLKKGDVVLIDFGARFSGYCSDETVTFLYGGENEEFTRFFNLVKDAEDQARISLSESLDISRSVSAVESFFSKNGVRDLFLHSLGHGVGIEVHESPILSKASKDDLCRGSIFTIEPGLYREGVFGVRLENMYLVKDEGLERLTTFPKAPTFDETMKNLTP